eukprot:6175-Hanusia_phi.AAC.3
MERSVLRGVIADLMRKERAGVAPLDPDLMAAESDNDNVVSSPSAWQDDCLASSSECLGVVERSNAADVGLEDVYVPVEWQRHDGEGKEETFVMELRNHDGTLFMVRA